MDRQPVTSAVHADLAQGVHRDTPSLAPLPSPPLPSLCRLTTDDEFERPSLFAPCRDVAHSRDAHPLPDFLFLSVDACLSETPEGVPPPPTSILCREVTYDEFDDRLLFDWESSWLSDVRQPVAQQSLLPNKAGTESHPTCCVVQQTMDMSAGTNFEWFSFPTPPDVSQFTLCAPWSFSQNDSSHAASSVSAFCRDDTDFICTQPCFDGAGFAIAGVEQGETETRISQHLAIADHLFQGGDAEFQTLATSGNWIDCESVQHTLQDVEQPGSRSIAQARGASVPSGPSDFLHVPKQVLMSEPLHQRELRLGQVPKDDEEFVSLSEFCGVDSDSAASNTGFVVSWTVREAASILFGGTSRIVSPWLETCFPAAPFKLTIHALAQAGKRSFRDAKGQGTLEVKCDTVLPDPVSFLLRFGGDVAVGSSLGPFTHDFGQSSVWRMPGELPAWDLRQVARETISVCLEILQCC